MWRTRYMYIIIYSHRTRCSPIYIFRSRRRVVFAVRSKSVLQIRKIHKSTVITVIRLHLIQILVQTKNPQSFTQHHIRVHNDSRMCLDNAVAYFSTNTKGKCSCLPTLRASNFTFFILWRVKHESKTKLRLKKKKRAGHNLHNGVTLLLVEDGPSDF